MNLLMTAPMSPASLPLVCELMTGIACNEFVKVVVGKVSLTLGRKGFRLITMTVALKKLAAQTLWQW